MIFYGEIVDSIPPSDQRNVNKLRYEYSVRTTFPNGTVEILRNAILMEPLSGVDNFHEVILRSSKEENGAGIGLSLSAADQERFPGDRCIISFLNGNPTQPVILGILPSPVFSPIDNNESDKWESLPIFAEKLKPQLRGRYNGFHYRIDDSGQIRLQHTGNSELIIQQGLFKEAIDEVESSITTLDFLKKGDFRIVDSNKQSIVIDAQNKFISLNNTTTAPSIVFEDIAGIEIEEPNDDEIPLGQEIRLDQAKENLSVLSSGTHKLIVGTDQLIKIFGNSDSTILENETRLTGGDFAETIGKNSTINVGESLITTVKKNIGLISDAGNSIFLDAAPGKEAIFISHTTGAQIVIDKDGSVKIVAQDGTYMFLNANTGEFSATTKAGALITAKENVVISDSDGTELITLKKGAIEINADKSVTVSATNVTINGGAVSLGAGAAMSVPLWEPLMAWLNTHSHSSALGPVSPPIIPATPALASASVKVKA